ncbi:hypothetical protein IB69_005990 [Xanthomonas citri]|nr:hypothetical protein IB69_005990 [Xanthomonas citri]
MIEIGKLLISCLFHTGQWKSDYPVKHSNFSQLGFLRSPLRTMLAVAYKRALPARQLNELVPPAQFRSRRLKPSESEKAHLYRSI